MTLSSKSAVNNRLSSGNTGNPGISKTTGSIEFSDDSGTKAIVGYYNCNNSLFISFTSSYRY